MDAGRPGAHRLRFDFPESPTPSSGPSFDPGAMEVMGCQEERLVEAVARTRDHLLSLQHDDGYWVGELEGDTILESEYILLLAYLGRERSEVARKAANYILKQQLPSGGWAIYAGGPLELSASVKAYFALKVTGHKPNEPYMVRAREAILAAGGAEKINSFTRYYLALLGIISYAQCPAVPPEVILLPKWMPFNIYEMSAWSRTILIPLSILWAYKPSRKLPAELGISELFRTRPRRLAGDDGPVGAARRYPSADAYRLAPRLRPCRSNAEGNRSPPADSVAIAGDSPGRGVDVRAFRGKRWAGRDLSPIIWSVVALKCLGHPEDSQAVMTALGELDKLMIEEDDAIRLQPCKSPVWDSAISLIALRDAGVSADHPAIRRAVGWLLSKEIRRQGDWALRNRKIEPSGWAFEFNNEFYPDVDDTSMVLMALCRSLPSIGSRNWRADFLLGNWSPHPNDKDAAAIVSARGQSSAQAFQQVEAAAPQLNAIWRGTRWLFGMQGRDGGFGAFDPDNTREIFTQVPFADHNAMIDPSTADLTSRMLELFGDLKIGKDHPSVRRAIEFVWNNQEPDHAWYGRWGVNYIYGTWQSLVGLTAIGIPTHDARIRLAADWLRTKQQADGGWGETPRSYDEPKLRGIGPTTASQTAWALMGLMAAGDVERESVRRGVDYLIETQNADGTWDEPWWTGTGFPKVFFLRYQLYPIYFPLMALARYARLASRE